MLCALEAGAGAQSLLRAGRGACLRAHGDFDSCDPRRALGEPTVRDGGPL